MWNPGHERTLFTLKKTVKFSVQIIMNLFFR